MTEPENNILRELTENELAMVGGGLTWGQVFRAVLIITAATAIGGPVAGATVAGDMMAGRM